jgi:hypothetical protein
MHFFYLEVSGDTGDNLEDENQPIFVLGGISVRDEGWNATQEVLHSIFIEYFDDRVPDNLELHSHELLCRDGDGPFEGHDIEAPLELTKILLNVLVDRSHEVHIIAIEKSKALEHVCEIDLPFYPKSPYLCGFDYLITYINWHVKKNLGRSARTMLIIDEKKQYDKQNEAIIHHRRFSGAKANRVKWVVEFCYSVDLKKIPMDQLSDLVVLCVRRFFEIENGYRDRWTEKVKNYYAECYSQIHARIKKKTMVERTDRNIGTLNEFVAIVKCGPSRAVGTTLWHIKQLTIKCPRTAKSAALRSSSLCFMLPMLWTLGK